MTPEPPLAALRELVQTRTKEEGLTQWANKVRVPLGRVRSVRDNRAPTSDTIELLANALGWEFYVGPPRRLLEAPTRDVKLMRMKVALEDAWALIAPHKRAALYDAILGNIELSCPSEDVRPGERLTALRRDSDGAA